MWCLVTVSRFALFLDTTARDVKSAEPVYLRAIEAAPGDADSLRNFAVFLSEKLKDFARADDYFARAVEVRCNPFPPFFDHFVQHIAFPQQPQRNHVKQFARRGPTTTK
jgi:hypothetical protein